MLLTTRSARILAACKYLSIMLKNAFHPCIPTKAAKVPDPAVFIVVIPLMVAFTVVISVQ